VSIFDLFRSKETPDLDRSVILQLRKAGSDLSKPHNLEFFVYFPTQSLAEQAALTMRNAEFQVDVSTVAQGDNWLCLATKTMVPVLPDLQKIRQDFVALSMSMTVNTTGGVLKSSSNV